MTDDPNSLIHGHLDDLLSDEQIRELNDWIKQDPRNARRFAAIALLHDRMHGQARASRVLMDLPLGSEDPAFPEDRPASDSGRGRGGWRRWGVAAALLIGAGLGVLATRDARRGHGDDEVATLVESRDIVWAEGQAPIALNVRIGLREIRSRSGAFKLAFDSGTVVSLDGPADVRVLSGMLIRVVRGRISARAGEGIKGFAIETPNTLVVDQGTEFGVEVDAAGQTDVVVFEGLVDLSCPEVGTQPSSIKRLSQGEAMRVGSTGNLSRIISVDRGPAVGAWSTASSIDRDAVIRSVRDNIRGLGCSKYYQIVHHGLDEDKPAFVDRIHEWNGVDASGLPGFLRGADYIMTFNEDKWREDLQITVEVGRAATLYILFDDRQGIPPWLSEQFVDTGALIGLDEGGTTPKRRADWIVAKGAGQSIDNLFSIWKGELPRAETIQLGGVGKTEKNPRTAMYGIAAVPRP